MAIDFSAPILVVEDSGATAQIVSRLLKQLGFQTVDLTQGGMTALAKLAERRYGRVISDLNMEPMSSLETASTAPLGERVCRRPLYYHEHASEA